MANGQSKGFGFIQMSSLEEQANVLRNKGIHTIGNRRWYAFILYMRLRCFLNRIVFIKSSPRAIYKSIGIP